MTTPRWYGAVLRLYPRSFRHEYGAEMRLLAAEMASDMGGMRLAGRIVKDLIVSVPRLRREETTMKSKAGFAVVIAMVVGLGVAGTGSVALGGALTLGAVGLIFGAAALVSRMGRAGTEDVYAGRRPVWIIAAAFAALYSAYIMVHQYVTDPTAGNLIAMAVGVGMGGLIAAGIAARMRGKRWGHWLVAIGAAPLLMNIWFLPALISATIAIVGSIAEAMKREPAASAAA